MGIGSAIIGGAALSAGAGILGSSKSASAQKDAAEDAAAVQKYQYDQTRKDYEPYRQQGQNSLAALNYEMGLGVAPSPLYEGDNGRWTYSGASTTFDNRDDAKASLKALGGDVRYQGFQATPGYQFQLDQGAQAIDRSAAARGGLFSGATMKASQQFGTGLANQEYGNYLNRLSGLAGTGQTATGAVANAGQSYANNTGNALLQAGQARASGYAGMANAINGGIQNGLGLYAMTGGFGA